MPVLRDGFAHEKVLVFAIVQLIQGLTAMILSIVLVASGSFMYFYGTGIWTGVVFIIAGSVGVLSARRKDDCTIIAFMVTSILAIIGSLFLLGFGAVGITHDARVPARIGYRRVHFAHSRLVLLHALMLIVAVIESLSAVYSAVLCCRAICCRRPLAEGELGRDGYPGHRVQGELGRDGYPGHRVQYLSQGMAGQGQQVMIITSGGYPGYGYPPGQMPGQMVYMAAPYVSPQGVVYPGPVVEAPPGPDLPVTPLSTNQNSSDSTAAATPTLPALQVPAQPPPYSTMDRNRPSSNTTGVATVAEGQPDATLASNEAAILPVTPGGQNVTDDVVRQNVNNEEQSRI